MKTRGAKRRRVQDSQFAGRLTLLVLMVLLSVGLVSASGATIAFATPFGPSGAGLAPGVPSAPLTLPGGAATSGTTPGTTPSATCNRCETWIVGARPGAKAAAIARRHGARPVAPETGIYRIPRAGAERFAGGLSASGQLLFAEPDVPIRPASYPPDLLSNLQTWLSRIVNPSDATPPRVGTESRLIGLIEQGIDGAHPDLEKAALAGAAATGDPETDSHGTAIAGIIGSPGEGVGIRGVWPGARMQHFPAGATCSTAAAAVIHATDAGAAVINMSYTFPQVESCYTHYLAIQYAVSRDTLSVAAAGNDARKGNPKLAPGIYPHVVSVAAVDENNHVASFSTRNRFVDLSAPGTDVFAPWVTVGKDADGTEVAAYTWRSINGTSFAAPMVSAAAAWLREVRPGWSAAQVTRALAGSATDLGKPGRDRTYGDGLLNIDAALLAPRPVDDAMEPNDDIPVLKGEGLVPKARYLWKPRGRKTVRLRATVSRDKDPADVYRIRIPARRQVLITAAQLQGSVKLTALKPSVKTLGQLKGKVIVRSDKPYPRTEGIKVRNLRRKARDIWLVVTPSRRDRAPHQIYRLKIRRTR